MDSFYKELNQKLLTCVDNEYYNNFDFDYYTIIADEAIIYAI